jgi:hypothetical protein
MRFFIWISASGEAARGVSGKQIADGWQDGQVLVSYYK